MMRAMKQLGMTAAIIGTMSAAPVLAQEIPADASNFYKSESVTVRQVTFPNQYNMNIAGNLFLPKNLDQKTKHAAIIVGHPMGAVKEQSANLYAVKMAEQGFVTLSVDLAFWGGSEGQPRNAVSPDLYAETFSAAADFLGTNPLVDRERIGVIGICGSGSFAISAAKIDPRLKAIATISMYDMGAANRNGLRHGMTLEQRKQILHAHRAGILRILPDAERGIHSGRLLPAAHHAPDVHQQRQVHELLPVLGHRDDFPAPHAVHRGRKGALHRVQRRRVQARGGTEGTVYRPRSRACGSV